MPLKPSSSRRIPYVQRSAALFALHWSPASTEGTNPLTVHSASIVGSGNTGRVILSAVAVSTRQQPIPRSRHRFRDTVVGSSAPYAAGKSLNTPETTYRLRHIPIVRITRSQRTK
jgi:hypothetical protein